MPQILPTCALLLPVLALAGCAAHKTASGMERAAVAGISAPANDTAGQDGNSQSVWADLRPQAPAAPQVTAQDAEYLNAPSTPARLLLCQLPLNIATDRAWGLTDESVLPAATRALWHQNGLRVGFLPEAKWEAFRQALNGQEKGAATNAGVLAQKLISLTLRPFPEPLHRGDVLPAQYALPLDTTLPPMAPHRTLLPVANNDRVQLLARAVFQDKAMTGFTLIPHLHHPRYFFGGDEPPKAWEKEVQGMPLEDLATAPLRPKAGQLLVIGLWWPWKLAKQPEKDELALSPTPPPLPVTLGRALFTERQGEGAFQVLLVLGVK